MIELSILCDLGMSEGLVKSANPCTKKLAGYHTLYMSEVNFCTYFHVFVLQFLICRSNEPCDRLARKNRMQVKTAVCFKKNWFKICI